MAIQACIHAIERDGPVGEHEFVAIEPPHKDDVVAIRWWDYDHIPPVLHLRGYDFTEKWAHLREGK